MGVASQEPATHTERMSDARLYMRRATGHDAATLASTYDVRLEEEKAKWLNTLEHIRPKSAPAISLPELVHEEEQKDAAPTALSRSVSQVWGDRYGSSQNGLLVKLQQRARPGTAPESSKFWGSSATWRSGGAQPSTGAAAPLRDQSAARLPPKVAQAADTYDRRHREVTKLAEQRLAAALEKPNLLSRHHEFRVALWDVSSHRFIIREELGGVTRYTQRFKKKTWKLEESIWAPRTTTCDSKAFYDSPLCARLALEKDWERALKCGLGRLINKTDQIEGELDGDANLEDVAPSML